MACRRDDPRVGRTRGLGAEGTHRGAVRRPDPGFLLQRSLATVVASVLPAAGAAERVVDLRLDRLRRSTPGQGRISAAVPGRGRRARGQRAAAGRALVRVRGRSPARVRAGGPHRRGRRPLGLCRLPARRLLPGGHRLHGRVRGERLARCPRPGRGTGCGPALGQAGRGAGLGRPVCGRIRGHPVRAALRGPVRAGGAWGGRIPGLAGFPRPGRHAERGRVPAVRPAHAPRQLGPAASAAGSAGATSGRRRSWPSSRPGPPRAVAHPCC
jgi:hypothetical protein